MNAQKPSNQNQQILDEVNDMGFGISPALRLEFSQQDTAAMKSAINNLFDLIKNGNHLQLTNGLQRKTKWTLQYSKPIYIKRTYIT